MANPPKKKSPDLKIRIGDTISETADEQKKATATELAEFSESVEFQTFTAELRELSKSALLQAMKKSGRTNFEMKNIADVLELQKIFADARAIFANNSKFNQLLQKYSPNLGKFVPQMPDIFPGFLKAHYGKYVESGNFYNDPTGMTNGKIPKAFAGIAGIAFACGTIEYFRAAAENEKGFLHGMVAFDSTKKSLKKGTLTGLGILSVFLATPVAVAGIGGVFKLNSGIVNYAADFFKENPDESEENLSEILEDFEKQIRGLPAHVRPIAEKIFYNKKNPQNPKIFTKTDAQNLAKYFYETQNLEMTPAQQKNFSEKMANGENFSNDEIFSFLIFSARMRFFAFLFSTDQNFRDNFVAHWKNLEQQNSPKIATPEKAVDKNFAQKIKYLKKIDERKKIVSGDKFLRNYFGGATKAAGIIYLSTAMLVFICGNTPMKDILQKCFGGAKSTETDKKPPKPKKEHFEKTFKKKWVENFMKILNSKKNAAQKFAAFLKLAKKKKIFLPAEIAQMKNLSATEKGEIVNFLKTNQNTIFVAGISISAVREKIRGNPKLASILKTNSQIVETKKNVVENFSQIIADEKNLLKADRKKKGGSKFLAAKYSDAESLKKDFEFAFPEKKLINSKKLTGEKLKNFYAQQIWPIITKKGAIARAATKAKAATKKVVRRA